MPYRASAWIGTSMRSLFRLVRPANLPKKLAWKIELRSLRGINQGMKNLLVEPKSAEVPIPMVVFGQESGMHWGPLLRKYDAGHEKVRQNGLDTRVLKKGKGQILKYTSEFWRIFRFRKPFINSKNELQFWYRDLEQWKGRGCKNPP